MKRYPLSFSVLFILLDLASWVAIFVVPVLLLWLRLKSGGHTPVGPSGAAVIVPAAGYLGFALQKSAWSAQGLITILNAPAKIVEVVVALVATQTISWDPEWIAPHLWRCLSYPLYALPAWWYVGKGLDGILGRARLTAGNMLASASLSLFSLAVATGLRFGLSQEERHGQGDMTWFIAGFAIWAALFAIPLVAWLLQRGSVQPE